MISHDVPVRRSPSWSDVASRRPPSEMVAEHHVRGGVQEDERAVREPVGGSHVVSLSARDGVEALDMELAIDRVGAPLAGMQLFPDLGETDVVLATAQRARAMPRRERGRLIEEEQLGVPAGLHQGVAPPPSEPELAGHPTLAVVASADGATLVVEAATVPVDQATGRVGDEFTERRDAVLAGHLGPTVP